MRYLLTLLFLALIVPATAQDLPSQRLPRYPLMPKFVLVLKDILDSLNQGKTSVPGVMAFVKVANYDAAKLQAVGTLPKRIRVANDGSGYPATYDYWPDSTAPDKLELIITN